MAEQYQNLIIIPCLNEQVNLERVVRSLIVDAKDFKAQIVICDGGSGDETISIAKTLDDEFPFVTYLHNPKKLQSAAVNLAVQELGRGKEYLIRVDAHAGYPESFCKLLFEEAQQTKADSVVVAMETVGKDTRLQESVAYAQNSKMGNGGSSHRNADNAGKWVDHGHHALMRIESFLRVDGYDESFSHNEDAELDKRLHDAGSKIWLSGRTSCDYYPRKNLISLYRQYVSYGRGRIKTLMKHRMIPKIRQMIPAFVFPALVLALASPIHAIAALPLGSWLLLCIGYGAVLGLKAGKVHVASLSGIAACCMHMGWSYGFWSGMVREVLGGRHER